jgi:hypothetical protein
MARRSSIWISEMRVAMNSCSSEIDIPCFNEMVQICQQIQEEMLSFQHFQDHRTNNPKFQCSFHQYFRIH